ncbi:DUF397 domain-containing protein [Streptomyces monomycini]|uniref:DUF397 domain-containing protein n=1 Tax=Streptomyces monomycini TaxID=371720 RepID=UPI003558A1C0
MARVFLQCAPQDDCVEVAASASGPILYRESDHPGGVAQATGHAWTAFLRAVKSSAYE